MRELFGYAESEDNETDKDRIVDDSILTLLDYDFLYQFTDSKSPCQSMI